jgi:hypothetical protein
VIVDRAEGSVSTAVCRIPATLLNRGHNFMNEYLQVRLHLDQKHLESFEMWYWRRMEKISWTDHVKN